MKQKIFIISLVIVLVSLLFGVTALIPTSRESVDDQTSVLCKQYASRDHEKEIAPERYKKLGKEFFDSFDWYSSCLNHIKKPVQK